jgi:hypothetical protein
LNNAKYSDLIVANYRADLTGIFLGYENGYFRSQKAFSKNQNPSMIAVNGNQLDSAVTNYNNHTVGILLSYGDGNASTNNFLNTLILKIGSCGKLRMAI